MKKTAKPAPVKSLGLAEIGAINETTGVQVLVSPGGGMTMVGPGAGLFGGALPGGKVGDKVEMFSQNGRITLVRR